MDDATTLKPPGQDGAPVDLSIVIVNWNSKDYLRACIESILASNCEVGFEIIVVDSASFDGCGEMLERDFSRVRFIQSETNLGFARANNLGVKHARGKALMFLNPDTKVLGRAIDQLYGHLGQLPKAGVLGCRLLNRDGSLQTSCVQPFPTILNQLFDIEILQRWFPKNKMWMTASLFEGAREPSAVEAVSGACMLMRREVFECLDGFSTDYFMYAEDVDLCHKSRIAGFTNYYACDAQIVHYGGGSSQHSCSRFSEVMIPESISRLLRKTHGNAYSTGYRLALSGAALLRMALLALFYPAVLISHRTERWRSVLQKWMAIFRWGMGQEKWVERYRPQD